MQGFLIACGFIAGFFIFIEGVASGGFTGIGHAIFVGAVLIGLGSLIDNIQRLHKNKNVPQSPSIEKTSKKGE